MKIWIPSVGDIIRLESDWSFDLFDEYRNSGLVEKLWPLPDLIKSRIDYHAEDAKQKSYRMAQPDDNDYWAKCPTFGETKTAVTLPKGCELRIDRIYIKKGAPDYNSLTFVIVSAPASLGFGKKRPRFWAKLNDVNNIEASIITP